MPGDIASEDEQDEFRAAARHACGMEGRVWQARRCGSSAAALGRVTGGGCGTELLIILSLSQRELGFQRIEINLPVSAFGDVLQLAQIVDGAHRCREERVPYQTRQNVRQSRVQWRTSYERNHWIWRWRLVGHETGQAWKACATALAQP